MSDATPTQDQTPGPDENEPRTPATDTNPDTDADEKPVEHHKRKAPAKKSVVTPAPKSSSHDWSYSPPDPELVSRIQRGLGRNGFYRAPADGKFDTVSRQGVQRAIEKVGYVGAINGHIGEAQVELIQQFAKEFGSYKGPINKHIDRSTWAGFAVALETLE